jgi:ABC-type transporter Mla subunit MlaD
MDSITKQLISFFHIDGIGLYLAGMLIMAGILVIAIMLTKFVSVRAGLKKMIQIIQKPKDREEFTEQYETIREKVLGVPGMVHAWKEFEETLIPPIEDIDDPNYHIYRNTKRPSEYFSVNSVHYYQVKAFIQPHTFVGLGLLFTFLGLVAALTETGQAFASSSVEEIQEALQLLLKVAGTKFWASVGGLFTSIVVGAALHSFNSSIRKQLHIICNLLEERLLYANHERIAVDQYGHAKRQTRRLEEMSTEITLALGDRISSAINELPSMLSHSLGETMQPVTDELRNVTQNLGQDNHSALKDMADEFAKNVAGSSQETFENVNGQLEKLVSTLEVTASKLSGGGNELAHGLEGAISNINQTMLHISDQLKETTSEAGSRFKDDAHSASNEFKEVMKDISEKLAGGGAELKNGLEDSISNMNQTMQAISVQLKNSTSEAGQKFKTDAESASTELKDVIMAIKTQQETSIGAISKLTESLENVTDSTSQSINTMIEQSGSQLGQVVQDAVGQTSKTVSAALENVGIDVERRVLAATTSAQESFVLSFDDLNSKLSTTSEGLTQSILDWKQQLYTISQRFEAISGQLNHQVTAVSEVNKQVQVVSGSFAESAQSVKSATAPLSQVTSQLNEASRNIDSLLATTLETTQKTSVNFNETLTTMAASVSGLEEAWESNGKHLKNVDSELESAFRQITHHMSSSLEQLARFAKELDSGLSGSLEQLSGFVMETRELVEDLSDVKARR